MFRDYSFVDDYYKGLAADVETQINNLIELFISDYGFQPNIIYLWEPYIYVLERGSLKEINKETLHESTTLRMYRGIRLVATREPKQVSVGLMLETKV